MKTGILAIIVAAIILTACSASSSTAKKEKNTAEYAKTAALIESGNYQFAVRSATPSGGKTVQLTSSYTLEARDGTYDAYLPYYGRAYSASYGGDGAVEFSGNPEDLKITRYDDKNKISVAFTMKSDKDQNKVTLNIGATGFGNLVVTSQKRQTISYYGLTSALKD